MKLTRHNGRSGKNGTYNPRHNDRRFDIENSEHIDKEKEKKNIYWSWCSGYSGGQYKTVEGKADISFEEAERMYYEINYSNYINAQNQRNEKNGHSERNRTIDDLLKNKKTCPEETIYQIGTMDDHISADTLFFIVNEFQREIEWRFQSHFHILDFALHCDEGSPHIHERHVFDCENRYGELCPQQEKALEKLGVPLPYPDKPRGKNNNRKQTFDKICRTILTDICLRHGVQIDQEPEYGGRSYLEKQDYILMKQKEKIAEQDQALDGKKQELEELTLKIGDVESFVDEISETAYEKACEVVTDTVREETMNLNRKVIKNYKDAVTGQTNKLPKKTKKIIAECLDVVLSKLSAASAKIEKLVQETLHKPEVKEEKKAPVKSSVLKALNENKLLVEANKSQRPKSHNRDQGMEL